MTLVDAKHASQHIEEVKPDGVVNEAVEQIAYADRIILNKVSWVYGVLISPMSSSDLMDQYHCQKVYVLYIGLRIKFLFCFFTFGYVLNQNSCQQIDLVKEFELESVMRQIKVNSSEIVIIAYIATMLIVLPLEHTFQSCVFAT